MYRILTILLIVLATHWEAGFPAWPDPASQPRHHQVDIQTFQFQPKQLTVAPGDTIVWINRDIVPHTVTENGGTWRSQPLEEGQSWEMVVDHHGPFTYFCEFHPHMIGVLSSR